MLNLGGQTETPRVVLEAQPPRGKAQCWGKEHSRLCTQAGQEGQSNAQGARQGPSTLAGQPNHGELLLKSQLPAGLSGEGVIPGAAAHRQPLALSTGVDVEQGLVRCEAHCRDEAGGSVVPSTPGAPLTPIAPGSRCLTAAQLITPLRAVDDAVAAHRAVLAALSRLLVHDAGLRPPEHNWKQANAVVRLGLPAGLAAGKGAVGHPDGSPEEVCHAQGHCQT